MFRLSMFPMVLCSKPVVRIINVLLLGGWFWCSDNVKADPFGEPVRYPVVPSTFLGVAQLGGKPVGAGSVLGFYSGYELRGSFVVSPAQIVGGQSYFNAVIQNSGQTEQLTKAVLWIPETGLLYEKALDMAMPLNATFADFNAIQTFSFTDVLSDEQIIPTLLMDRFEGFSTPKDQPLKIAVSRLTGFVPANLPSLDQSTPSGSRLVWNGESQGFTYHPRRDFLGTEWVLVPLPEGLAMGSFFMNITVQSAELAPHLRIDRQAGKVVVTWEGSYVLLVTQDLKSPFEPILNAKSPFSPDMVDGMFYALGAPKQ